MYFANTPNRRCIEKDSKNTIRPSRGLNAKSCTKLGVSLFVGGGVQSRDESTPGICPTRLEINHQTQSAVVCSASHVKGELHPATFVRSKVFLLSCIWMIVTAYTLPRGCSIVGGGGGNTRREIPLSLTNNIYPFWVLEHKEHKSLLNLEYMKQMEFQRGSKTKCLHNNAEVPLYIQMYDQ